MLNIQLALYWLLVPSALSYPNRELNATSPCDAPKPTTIIASTVACQTIYPQLHIMNSRYPAWDMSPLQGRNDMFMILRQREDTFQIVSQVQFTALSVRPNATCQLQLQLPSVQTQTIAGPEPIFNVYQVEREAASAATWEMYEAKNLTEREPSLFGQVNGTDAAREQQEKEHAGIYNIGRTSCNDTLTFQMGMAFNSGNEVNYWDFVNVALPAMPAQGFRLLADC